MQSFQHERGGTSIGRGEQKKTQKWERRDFDEEKLNP